MANLLDEASILLTATAYDNGRMLAVKPENGDGDFTFSRNSAATRVNAQGLVENVASNLPRINHEGFSYQDALGSELVVNGDFSNGLSGWSAHSGSTLELVNGMAKVTTSNNSGYIKRTDLLIQNGKTYFCKVDITNATSLGLIINGLFDVVPLSLISGNTYGGYMTVTGNYPTFYLSGNYINGEVSYIDNVSIKEVLGQEVVPNSGCGNWLMETQSTNLITQSELFTDSSWIKSNSSITSNSVISPDGTLNADKLVENNSNSTHFCSGAFAGTDIETYSFSVFAKKLSGDRYLQLSMGNNISGSIAAKFDLDNGLMVYGTTLFGSGYSVGDAKIEQYPNGWYKCSISGNKTNLAGNNHTNIQLHLNTSVLETNTYAGNGTSGIYVWGAMLEQNSDASSYIPTTSGAISTRLRDIPNNSGNASLINSESGVLYAEIKLGQDYSSSRYIGLSDGGTSNRIIFGASANQTDIVTWFIGSGGQVSGSAYGVDFSIFNKIALKYSENNVALWINGVNVSTELFVSMPIGLNTLVFNQGDGINPFYGNTKALAVFPDLTDAQLTELTTI